MTDIIKYIEYRRAGLITEAKFQSGVGYSVGSTMRPSPIGFKCVIKVEDATVLHNRLLCIDNYGDVSAYDVSPQRDFDPHYMNHTRVAFWNRRSRRTRRNHSLANYCVNWAKSGLFFTVTGKKNDLYIVDGNEFQLKDTIPIPLAEFTTMHLPSPNKEHVIGVASDYKAVAVMDLEAGVYTYTGPEIHTRGVSAIAFSEYDPTCLLAANSSEVLLWDLRIQAKPPSFNISVSNDTIPEMRFIDRTKFVILCNTNKLVVWDMLACKSIHEITGLDIDVRFKNRRIKYDVELDSNPKLLYIPSRRNVKVVNLTTGEIIGSVGNHIDPVKIVRVNDRLKEVYTFSKYEGQIWRPFCYAN